MVAVSIIMVEENTLSTINIIIVEAGTLAEDIMVEEETLTVDFLGVMVGMASG